MLIRLHEIADFERAQFNEPEWSISDVCREALQEYTQRRLEEIKSAGGLVRDLEDVPTTKRRPTYALRVQVDARFVDRIQAIILHDMEVLGGSERTHRVRLCAGALEEYLQKREQEIAALQAAGPFLGDTPVMGTKRKRRKSETVQRLAAN